jgi:hypothetical protein
MFHPNLHCVVPRGGLSPDGDRWPLCRPASSCPCACSRACVPPLVSRAVAAVPSTLVNCISLPPFNSFKFPLPSRGLSRTARQAEWVVYAQKAPLAGPPQVLDYVGRYTHRVAISNHRLLDIENGQFYIKL